MRFLKNLFSIGFHLWLPCTLPSYFMVSDVAAALGKSIPLVSQTCFAARDDERMDERDFGCFILQEFGEKPQAG